MNVIETAPQNVPDEDTCSANGSHPGIVHDTISLRCFVYRVRDNCYLAECIDLDISVEAPTPAKAKKGLYNAILGYLHVTCAAATDEQDIRQLILRPSPLTHRLRYYAWRILPKPGKRDNERFFSVPAPCHC
jgi:hypothetical protein